MDGALPPQGFAMTQRLDYQKQSPDFFKKLIEMTGLENKSSIEEAIVHLVHIRASQLNGCAFCLDMHTKQAKIHGERELRLYHIAIWRESNLFNARERACLAWTEALTKLTESGAPDSLYEQVREHLSEKEISDLTFIVATINAWNRLSIAFKSVPGSFDKAWGLDKAALA
jgi:AhpD family alkylhydroperoxidase